MQKKLLSVSIATLLVIASNAQAQTGFGFCNYNSQTVDSANCAGPASLRDSTVKNDTHIAGPLKVNNSTLHRVDIAGIAELHNATIKGKASIAGTLHATQSAIQDIQIAGSAEIAKSTITGNADVMGYLSAVDTHFGKNLLVASEKIDLKSSSVAGDITVKTKHGKPVVQLICGSHVKGSITFSENAGVVEVSADSKVSGKINNGTTQIIKKSCD